VHKREYQERAKDADAIRGVVTVATEAIDAPFPLEGIYAPENPNMPNAEFLPDPIWP
jgi:hypothetical protein